MHHKPAPIHRRNIKYYSHPRDVLDGPLTPGLKQHRHSTYAVGFRERITSSDDDFYPEIENTPMGFVGKLYSGKYT